MSGEALGWAPAGQGLDHAVRAAGGEQAARKTDAEAAKAVPGGAGRRDMYAKEVSQVTVHGHEIASSI